MTQKTGRRRMHSLTGILPQGGRGEGLAVPPAHLPGGQSGAPVVRALQQGSPLLAAHRRACSHTTSSPQWIWKEKFPINNASMHKAHSIIVRVRCGMLFRGGAQVLFSCKSSA